ncbi:hypothetical protein [Streptomyces cellulosae]|uniref:Uncharacterized protein n=1 Tax=Streptomyces cellulosae TaxID=1968 RepID=A0ABW7Y0W0_STRCE
MLLAERALFGLRLRGQQVQAASPCSPASPGAGPAPGLAGLGAVDSRVLLKARFYGVGVATQSPRGLRWLLEPAP